MAQTTCPVCETAVIKETGTCPECGWDIDRSAGEPVIGDPAKLQQEAEQRYRQLQHYRKLYQQGKQVKNLEKGVAELKQERHRLSMHTAEINQILERRAAAWETTEQSVKYMQRQHRKQIVLLVVAFVCIMIGTGVVVSFKLSSLSRSLETLNTVLTEQTQDIQRMESEVQALTISTAELHSSLEAQEAKEQAQEKKIRALQIGVKHALEAIKVLPQT